MENIVMTSDDNAIKDFFDRLDDNNPCTSCELRRMMMELMNNNE